MRIILVFILFLLLGQQTTVNGQQALCTVPELVEGTTSGGASLHLCDSASKEMTQSQTHSGASLRETDFASFHEYQIRKADSLYKNYLPQYNFDEVKAAMDFFDSIRNSGIQEFRNSGFKVRGLGKKDSKNPEILKSSNLEFLNARAHYYHAVGLTERDDIVGACEHYLIALEIMEPLVETHRRASHNRRSISVDNPEDYEKIRFVALIYTRLGEMCFNQGCCELSVINYKKALYFSSYINDYIFKSNTIKCIGNAHHLLNNIDSAIYCFNLSLKTNMDLNNKLDVDKCIAQIIYERGDKDSAYIMLKNNLKKIKNENVKYSYHFTLGNMFYIDKEYDSALYYLEKSLDENIITQKIAFTTRLSSIYDSLGNYEKRAYYDNVSSKLLINKVNKEINKSELQILYNDYIDRKIINREQKVKKIILIVSICFVVTFVIVIIFIRYKHIKLNSKLSEEIKAKERRIKDGEFKYSYVVGKIKSKNLELQKKEKQIKAYQFEIAELKNDIEKRKDDSVDKIKCYSQSEICVKILNEIRELAKSNKDTSELEPLSKEEFVLLFRSANLHLGIFLQNISNKYPSLKKDDLYYLCLVLINLNDKQIAALFGLTYDAIRKRRYKIASILGVNTRENLYKSIIELF